MQLDLIWGWKKINFDPTPPGLEVSQLELDVALG